MNVEDVDPTAVGVDVTDGATGFPCPDSIPRQAGPMMAHRPINVATTLRPLQNVFVRICAPSIDGNHRARRTAEDAAPHDMPLFAAFWYLLLRDLFHSQPQVLDVVKVDVT